MNTMSLECIICNVCPVYVRSGVNMQHSNFLFLFLLDVIRG